jgi:predicted RNA-binding protein associated with RNAse of E/G family
VALRELWQGRVWTAMPAVVVSDVAGELRLFIPAGTAMKYAVDPAGRELRLYADDWALADHVTSRSILSFSWPDAHHTVLAMWDTGWTFSGWYVNLETALGRDGRWYDFVDHCLDVLIPPDRSTWSWKDEDELEQAVRDGIFSPEEAETFRAEGERAATRLMNREPPFDRDWSGWRPEAGWPVPTLLDGWDTAGP